MKRDAKENIKEQYLRDAQELLAQIKEELLGKIEKKKVWLFTIRTGSKEIIELDQVKQVIEEICK